MLQYFKDEPSKVSGKGEECFGGRKEHSSGVSHFGEWHLQTQQSALPILYVSISFNIIYSCTIIHWLNTMAVF